MAPPLVPSPQNLAPGSPEVLREISPPPPPTEVLEVDDVVPRLPDWFCRTISDPKGWAPVHAPPVAKTRYTHRKAR